MEIILVRWQERNRESGRGEEVLAYPVSSKTLTIIWCLGGKGSENGERENDKEKILKNMVVQSRENVPFYPFSILILFSWSMMSARYGEIW